ncbi:N-alpha-acetyl-L-2,4-diaminobutyrate deacetylase [Pseudomonas segetis]|uniref:N-alpha-acetyl-L-2,4-diaminobutyrate deacetylase n=2 Tax=Pseudomonas segetis TaxID=298908 RepID=A0A239G6K3_9PSED|nr:N-alpha-acetyl-L-2,4-diaminobutyrate deacetylase [Pseudomonas segetis]
MSIAAMNISPEAELQTTRTPGAKTLAASTISVTVDFDQDGVQHGFLKLPYSHDLSAWGCIMIPITVVKNGNGPTALMTGGNHGDEYEGITALLKLASELRAGDVQGRVIIVPAMNYPAVQNASRTSPIDKGNMNRSFPGNPYGSMTERIADYFQRTLIPLCDYALDIHSGGKTLDILPFAAAHRLQDPEQEAKCIAGAQAFGTAASMILFELDAASLYDTAVEAQGKVFVTTELGGGGTSTPKTMALADRGVRNFLRFAGITQGQLEPADEPQVLLDMPDASCYVQSLHRGILELNLSIGDRVRRGDLVARVHAFERTGTPAVEYHAERDGLLVARRFPALVDIGDTLAVIADIVEN